MKRFCNRTGVAIAVWLAAGPVGGANTHPAFTGFANPSINDDIALMRLASPLPPGLVYPSLGSTDIGDIVTLVGFGRSGYGSYGYTSSATLTDRRFGSNVIDTLSLVEPYEDWILDPTGIPEPGAGVLLLMGLFPLVLRRARVRIFKR